MPLKLISMEKSQNVEQVMPQKLMAQFVKKNAQQLLMEKPSFMLELNVCAQLVNTPMPLVEVPNA